MLTKDRALLLKRMLHFVFVLAVVSSLILISGACTTTGNESLTSTAVTPVTSIQDYSITSTPTPVHTPLSTVVSSTISRNPWPNHPEQMQSFITPNDPAVQAVLNEILGQSLGIFCDFEALRDWVSSHVSYRHDQDVHGVSEYWQYPSETLSLGTGDCEDFAILLCSLLRAYGVPADQVYVVVGVSQENTGHAYLIEKWYQGIWRVTEPQDGAWKGVLFGDWSTLVSYETLWCFNDYQYFNGTPTLPVGVYEFQLSFIGGSSTTFEHSINNGQVINASVEWLGKCGNEPEPFTVFGWGLRLYNPHGCLVVDWFGGDLSRSFSYSASMSGEYELQVYIGGGLPASGRLTADPLDWAPTAAPTSMPTCKPDIRIESVTLPSNAQANSGMQYPTTFKLVNNESVDFTITWQAHSSVSGDYDMGTVIVPKNGYADITRSYSYTVVGPATITYSIYCNGTRLDTWSGTMNIGAFMPNVKIQNVTLPSNAKKRPSSEVIFVTTYTTTLRIANYESVDITVSWQGYSSAAGNFDSGTLTVPKNSYVDVTRAYYYTTSGVVQVTYTLLYEGNRLDTWSGIMNVSP